MFKITKGWLEEQDACSDGKDWFSKQKESDAINVVGKLFKQDHFNWANWLIVRLMTHKQKVQYAIFAAKEVIEIYEKKYPDDKRPRTAIEAAEKWISDPSDKNAYAAANAADAAADAANAAAYAAANAAYATADAAAKKKLQAKILKYGISLLEVKPRGSRG